MKAYFVLSSPPDHTYRPKCFYHWMSLPNAGYVLVLYEGVREKPPGATELPHLLAGAVANSNGTDHTLNEPPTGTPIAGVLQTDTTFQVAMKLATINKHFHP